MTCVLKPSWLKAVSKRVFFKGYLAVYVIAISGQVEMTIKCDFVPRG